MSKFKSAYINAMDDFRLDCARSWPQASRTRILWSLAVDSGLRAVLCFRFQQLACQIGFMPLARLISRRNLKSNGIDVVPGARIGPGLVVRHPVGIVVGHNVIAGRNLTLLQGTTLGQVRVDGASGDASNPRLGDDVIIGAGAAVLGSVLIGDGAIVGASAVVTRDVPTAATAVGNPARILIGVETSKENPL